MRQVLKTLRDRRQTSRVEFQGRVELDIPQRETHLRASSMNLSEGGVCVRLQETLEIRAPVRLRMFTPPSRRPFECAGRVTWVIQRLDLRDTPPFLYDVGVEFIDPPSRFRHFASRIGLALRASLDRPPTRQISKKRVTATALQPATIRGRIYVPAMREEPLSPNRWHLVVMVDGTPCFSQRYPSMRKALDGWKRFKRQALDRRLVR